MICRRNRKGAVLNVRTSKLSVMLPLEKVKHLYFSSHRKVLSPNLSFTSQIHHWCSKDLARLLVRKTMGLSSTPKHWPPASSLTNDYGGGWAWFYTKQKPHIPNVAQSSWLMWMDIWSQLEHKASSLRFLHLRSERDTLGGGCKM